MPATAGAAAQVHDEDNGKLQPLRRMNRHEADGIAGVDDGIRFVAGREPLDVLSEWWHRRVAAVLDTADHRANFFQVFSRLTHARASRLERISSFIEDELENFGRRQPIDELEPSLHALPCALQHESILAIERRQIDRAA